MTRGMGALSRAVGIAWRRSLQLRVVALTLGLSLAVILALGFVLTSQLTNRVLDVKVKAATEQLERARTTVGGIVNGEETRSLDSSLQLARNTLTSKADSTSGAGLAGAFDAVLMVPGVTSCHVETVWEPPWDPSRMTEEARLQLNMF